jgi:tRNA-dihydrouridine synthase C
MNARLDSGPNSRFDGADNIARTPLERGLFLALAPMDGVTDAAYRELMTELFAGKSGISICISEFVRVTDQLLPPSVFLRDCPELRHEGRTKSGVPVHVQLLGSDPQAMAANAKRAVELGAPGIDLNFGCPAKTVNQHDGGACLLKTPIRVETVTRAVRDAVSPDVPVSAKIRLGWENSDCVEEIARCAQQGGASWITIHGRTRAQLYAPPVDWRAIARARHAVTIPVVANGDINDVASFARCAEESSCQSFMLGRATMGRPELFMQIRGHLGGYPASALTFAELFAILEAYIRKLRAGQRTEMRMLGLLKQWLRFASAHRREFEPIFAAIKLQSQLDSALATLHRFAACEAMHP